MKNHSITMTIGQQLSPINLNKSWDTQALQKLRTGNINRSKKISCQCSPPHLLPSFFTSPSPQKSNFSIFRIFELAPMVHRKNSQHFGLKRNFFFAFLYPELRFIRLIKFKFLERININFL